MNSDAFDLAVADETLWKGYEQWLDEQAALATFERLLDADLLRESAEEKFLTY